MKKFFIITVLAIASFSNANAQVTWNVRAGGGIITSSSEDTWGPYYWGYSRDIEGVFALALESNIPFKRGGKFCFSPSVIGVIGESQEFIFPLLLGYKVQTSQHSLLIPKVGLNVGCFIGEYDPYAIVGPSAALNFEYKHFVMGINASFNLIGDLDMMDGSSFLFTLGYKF